MLIAEHSDIPAAARSSEVLIVGAGAVGIALAVKLARQGRHVTLLEGGPAEPRADYRRANAGPLTGRAFLGLAAGRMKALGGTTRLWGGQLVPFSQSDIEGETYPGKRRWPLNYAEYRRYVGEAFALLGVAEGDTDDAAVWHAATGLPTGFGPDLAFGMNIWLRQPDFAKLFANDLATLDTLRIITGAEVRRLAFAPGGRIAAVDTARGTFAGRHVVLACGTIEIARLLLRTAALEPDCGFAQNRHLGRWFIDHLHGVAGEVVGADTSRLGHLFDYVHHNGVKFGVKARLTDAARAQRAIANGVATINPRMGLRESLREFLVLVQRLAARGQDASLLQAARHAAVMLRITVPMAWRYLLHRRSSLPFAAGVALGIEIEQAPAADSYIFLDPDEPPATARAGVHWALDGQEMKTVQAVCLAIRDTFAQQGLGEIRLDPRIEAGDAAFLADCHDAYHQMGGARMAETAEDGVVDGNLKVFGTDNLHVLGAAVFPSGSFANPTLSAIALAMRLGDHLSAEQC